MPPLPVRAGAASRAGRVPGARARLRGVLRVERVPLQVLGAAGQPLPPQHHLGRAVLHHPAAREGANASEVRGEQPRDGGVHRQGVPVRCVPASALLTPPPSPGSPERTTASQVQQLGRGVFTDTPIYRLTRKAFEL